MIYTLLNRDKDGKLTQIFSFESVQSFTESLRSTISSSTVEFGFPISDNITTENPSYSLSTVISAYSIFNGDREIYWDGNDFVSQGFSSGDTNPHITMRDEIKKLWKDRQIISILEGDKASFSNSVEERYEQLTSKYYKEYDNCAITSLEIDTGESSNGVIFLKMSIEQLDVAYVEFAVLQEDQMQPPLKAHSKVVTDLGTSKTSTTDDDSKDKPSSKDVSEKKSDVSNVKKHVKTATEIENDQLKEAVKAYETAEGLQSTGDPSNYKVTNVGGSYRLDRKEGTRLVGGN